MLIRPDGYNDGGKEYLEEGQKNSRAYTREELDERVIIDGDLDLTQMIYQQIPDKGQERYTTFVISFREDEVSNDDLFSITKEFKQFLMYAYKDDEYNFYAEAHLPKLKEIKDKKTGVMMARKPHIHVFIPRKNLLSDREMNPRGMYDSNVKYFEAFQEYINQKYKLESPREHIRVDPTNVADVLSRYKGDDFRSKNREFKKQLVADVIDKGIYTREGFYSHVATFGESRIRNEGKENEYIAVKLPGDAKFTNLKETIFQDEFVVRREIKKLPLDKNLIRERLSQWPQRAKEIKYVSKAGKSFRTLYKSATQDEKINLLAQRQADFYDKYRGRYELHPAEWQRDNQRSAVETERRGITEITDGVQSVSGCDVATDRSSEHAQNTVFLPGDAYFHLGQPESGRSAGLRHHLPAGERRGNPGKHHFDRFTALPGVPTVEDVIRRRGYRIRDGMGEGYAGTLNLPPYARNPQRVATLEQIQQRGQRLFGSSDRPLKSNTVNPLHRVMPKRDKNASFVAAYFLRQHEQHQLLPEHRREIRTVDTQFFIARRAILGDDRLTRHEKTQYISILTFERLKAHHAIKQPAIPFKQESPAMGSADIRQLMKEKRIPNNSISNASPEEKAIPPARERFARLIKNLSEHLAEKRIRDRQRIISTRDLYTKRAKLSKNVHYLDKKTDRTLFVDTGNAIAVRKGGMTDSAVAVALALAKEKFGSTLTIKGSDEFRKQVIEVAVRNNLDVHFTDELLNQQFEERKAELAIAQEGQRIEQSGMPASATPDKLPDIHPDEKGSEAKDKSTPALTRQAESKPFTFMAKVHEGVLLEYGSAPYKFKPDMNKPADERDDSYFVKLKTEDGKIRTLWGVGLQDAVSGLKQGERVKFEDKGVEEGRWTEMLKEGSTVEKSTQRRIWEGSSLDGEREQHPGKPVAPQHPTDDYHYDGPDVA